MRIDESCGKKRTGQDKSGEDRRGQERRVNDEQSTLYLDRTNCKFILYM